MGVNLSVSNRDISEEEGKGWEGRAMMEEHPLGTNKEVQETRQHWVLSRNELGNFVSSVTPTQEGAAPPLLGSLSFPWLLSPRVILHFPGNFLGFTFIFITHVDPWTPTRSSPSLTSTVFGKSHR